jgi:glycosyltransferase involved in cell wall biosynthesis
MFARVWEKPMTAAPKISVIIPHYNDVRGLAICLDRLADQTVPKDAFEIIVADNDSPQGEEAIRQLIAGRAKLVVVRERGAGPARNGGAAVARGEIFAFIDSDCQAEPQWLAEGVAALASSDFVGGRVKVLVDDPSRMTPSEAFESVFTFDIEDYVARKGFAGSGNLFCPRRVFQTVGGFRTRVSEDVDWSHRATRAGYRLAYSPRAAVGHPARRTWRELVAKWRRVNAETFALLERRRAARFRWLLRTLAMPASALVHTPKVLASDRLNSFRQRIDGLAILYRLRLWRFADSLRLLATDTGR